MIFSLIGGFILLFVAGDLLVRGASSLAEKLGVQPLVVGIVIVGFGTSVPELATSVQAALQGAPGIAIGNVVGSNMANMLLVLGAGALVYPIVTKRSHIFRDGGFGAFGALVLLFAAWQGGISRTLGVMLVVGLVGYLWYLINDDRKQRNNALEESGQTKEVFKWSSISIDSLILLAGLVGVLLGGKFLVDGAIELAKVYNIDEGIVGLTVVAFGTSLPELATSIIAAFKRETDLAIGNILGSNIYNIFGIAGITAIISPIPITSHFASVDIPLLFVMSLVLMGIVIWQHGVNRITGGLFITGYLTYVISLLA